MLTRVSQSRLTGRSDIKIALFSCFISTLLYAFEKRLLSQMALVPAITSVLGASMNWWNARRLAEKLSASERAREREFHRKRTIEACRSGIKENGFLSVLLWSVSLLLLLLGVLDYSKMAALASLFLLADMGFDLWNLRRLRQ